MYFPELSSQFVLESLINIDKPVLVEATAGHRAGDQELPNLMLTMFTMPIWYNVI